MNTSDLETWIAEKRPLVTSKDYGKDEDGTLKLLKKNKVFQNFFSNSWRIKQEMFSVCECG